MRRAVGRDSRSPQVGPGTPDVDLHMKAGDAAVFVDSIAHGSVRRTNPGERRIAVYRYVPVSTLYHQSSLVELSKNLGAAGPPGRRRRSG